MTRKEKVNALEWYCDHCGDTCDKCGYPHFLLYIGRQWRYISAKYFIPLEEDE